MRLFALATLILALVLPAAAAEPEPRDYARWESEVAAIEQRSAKEQFAPGGIVFVGSSSVRLWDLKKSFPDLPVANHGFGGSTIADSVHFVDRLVLRWKPKTLVFYAGVEIIVARTTRARLSSDGESGSCRTA